MNSSPKVVISIDFELRWGVHDVYGLDFNTYRENLENSRLVVSESLDRFAERDIHATWACVGALALSGWDEYFDNMPITPVYHDEGLKISEEYANLDPDGVLHFAPELIEKISLSKNQELGSHTFSHIYFREPGVTAEDFLREMDAVKNIWNKKYKLEPESLVFPRNQSAFTELLPQTTIKVWRDSTPGWYHDCNTNKSNTLLPKILRFADSVNANKRTATEPGENSIKSSLFIRFNLPEIMWKQHLKRISSELDDLAPGKVFHIWWHPHNLGIDTPKRLARLVQILDIIADKCETRKIESMTMLESVT